MPSRLKRTIVLTGLCLAAATLAIPAPAQLSHDDVSLEGFLRIFESGNQDEFQRYIEKSFDPEALRKTDAVERADRLARSYVDTGGYVVTGPVKRLPGAEIAVAKGKLTDLPYCLSLKSANIGGRKVITEFSAVDLPVPAATRLKTPGPKEVARTATEFMDRLGQADTFSGVFVIAKDGRPFVRKAYGKASLAYDIPNTLDTRFSIASIGKSITAVVIGQLLDSGGLSLDDKVGKFLPDYPDQDVREKVTVRHLLTHTSGLGSKSEFTASPLWPKVRTRIRTIDDYIPLIVGHPLESEPGTKYSYSNAGFVILGKIIEKVTGHSYYDVVVEKVFVPAGMTHSFFPAEDEGDPTIAVGMTNFVPVGDDYGFRLGPKRNAGSEGGRKGGSHGGVFVTADDLLNFMTSVRTGKLTSLPTARLLTTAQGVGRLEDSKNGYGFEIMTQNGHTIVGHGGGDIGISAFLYHFNDSGYTTIVLSNYDPRAIRVIARKFRGLLTRSVIGTIPAPSKTDCST